MQSYVGDYIPVTLFQENGGMLLIESVEMHYPSLGSKIEILRSFLPQSSDELFDED